MTRSLSFAIWVIALFVIGYMLIAGAKLLIPLVIAGLIAFSLIAFRDFFVGKKMNAWLASLLSLFIHIAGLAILVSLLNANFGTIAIVLPTYQQRFVELMSSIFHAFGAQPPQNLESIVQQVDFASVATGILSFVRTILSNMTLITFYTIFFILEHKHFSQKLQKMFGKSEAAYKKTIKIFRKIESDVALYFMVKAIISLITSLLSYIVLTLFKFDLALAAALLIFVLNFIPTIGSVLASLFPIMVSLVQYDSLYPFIAITLSMGFIQVMMGNMIEPRLVGNRLNLSPLVILFSLAFWGVLWGIPGMILSVPIMVIINSLLAQFPNTRPLAIMFSEKGEIE